MFRGAPREQPLESDPIRRPNRDVSILARGVVWVRCGGSEEIAENGGSLIERNFVRAEILTRFPSIPLELHASQCSPAASDFAAQASARGRFGIDVEFQSTAGEIGRLAECARFHNRALHEKMINRDRRLCGSQLRQRVWTT